MEILVIIVLIVILVGSWVISTQRKLVVMDENINNAMGQIGVQLSSRFDVITALLDIALKYDSDETQKWIETVKAKRDVITAKSAPKEVLAQEELVLDVAEHIFWVTEQYPELKTDKNYRKCMDAMDSYERMMRTSTLIYNDSVTTLNKAIRMLPASLIAGILGFHERGYLEAVKPKR